MSWGNGFDTEGQRAREFSLREGCLEYGQYVGNTWSAVRAPTRVGDGVWRRVSVTKKGKDVRLYLYGKEVAAGNIDNAKEREAEDMLVGSFCTCVSLSYVLSDVK